MARTTNTATSIKGKHPGTGHTCGECSGGLLSGKFINKDVSGKPFVKTCEHSEYATNAAGEHICLISTAACQHFMS